MRSLACVVGAGQLGKVSKVGPVGVSLGRSLAGTDGTGRLGNVSRWGPAGASLSDVGTGGNSRGGAGCCSLLEAALGNENCGSTRVLRRPLKPLPLVASNLSFACPMLINPLPFISQKSVSHQEARREHVVNRP